MSQSSVVPLPDPGTVVGNGTAEPPADLEATVVLPLRTPAISARRANTQQRLAGGRRAGGQQHAHELRRAPQPYDLGGRRAVESGRAGEPSRLAKLFDATQQRPGPGIGTGRGVDRSLGSDPAEVAATGGDGGSGMTADDGRTVELRLPAALPIDDRRTAELVRPLGPMPLVDERRRAGAGAVEDRRRAGAGTVEDRRLLQQRLARRAGPSIEDADATLILPPL